MSGLRRPINALGGGIIEHYKKEAIICDLVNGATKNIDFYKSLFYLRGQGGGGGGGNNNYWNNGTGGGSGAGFEGYIRFKKKCTLLVGAGNAGVNSTKGGDSYIDNVMILGGGKGGGPASGGEGGVFQFLASPETANIVSITVQGNGNNGINAPSNAGGISGANSVLTNSGGGQNSNSATAPGAGGGGQWQWGGGGGIGGAGEILIKYIGR